jgi:hypothetical protein
VDLLERYLEAVRRSLPQAQADDIVAELGDDLRQQMEEREGDLGRALNEEEVAAILKRRGHPMKVASSFLPNQFLIGPALYPTWRFVVKLVLGWILPPVFLLIVLPASFFASGHHARAILEAAVGWFRSELFSLGCITAVFAILDRTHHSASLFRDWDPRKLPRVALTLGEHRIPRSTAVGEIIGSVIAVAFWVALMEHGARTISLGAADVAPAPVWHMVEWPILLLAAHGIALGWFSLVRPYAVRARFISKLTVDALYGIVIGVLLSAGTWVTVAVPSNPAAEVEATHGVNLGFEIGLLSFAAIILVDAMIEITHAVSRRRRSAVYAMNRHQVGGVK